MGAAVCTRGAGPHRKCGALLDIRVVDGRLVESCPACERRRAGICRDCPRPVDGTIGKALRCAMCKAEAKRRAWRKSEENNREKRRASQRRRWRKSAELRARKREQRRAWAEANPDAVKRHKRRYALKQTPGYRAGVARNNARPERQEAKRRQARERYYAENPVRPDPHCAGCSERIPYDAVGAGGRAGAPPKWCDRCCTPAELRRREKQRAAGARTVPQAAEVAA